MPKYEVVIQKGFTERFKSFNIESSAVLDLTKKEAEQLYRRRRVLSIQEYTGKKNNIVNSSLKKDINKILKDKVVFICKSISLGRGGAEKSVISICKQLSKEKYDIEICNIDTLKIMHRGKKPRYNPGFNLTNNLPKAIIAQSNCAGTAQALFRTKPVIKIQYVQDTGFADVRWDLWDHIIANSEFTRDWCMKNGWHKEIYIQKPILDDEIENLEITPQHILMPNFKASKGSDLFLETAKILPNKKFVAINMNANRIYTPLPNVTIYPYQHDMSDLLSKTSVCINMYFPGKSKSNETFCRSAAEAIGNGIPCLHNRNGNLPYFSKVSNLVDVVDSKDPSAWASAILNIKGRKGDKLKDAFSKSINGITEILTSIGINKVERLPPLSIIQTGGLGDGILILPPLSNVAKHRDVYISPKSTQTSDVLKTIDFIKSGLPPSNAQEIYIPPFDKDEPTKIHVYEDRVDFFARRLLTDHGKIPKFKPNTNITKKVSDVLIKNNNINIGFSPYASSMIKSMPKDHVDNVIEALSKYGNIYLLHRNETIGTNDKITDTGGKFTVEENVHFINLLNCVIAVDSFNAHAAGFTETPLVVLLGQIGINNHIRYKKTYNGPVKELCMNLECIPCWSGKIKTKCKTGPICLRFFPDIIIKSIKDLLHGI